MATNVKSFCSIHYASGGLLSSLHYYRKMMRLHWLLPTIKGIPVLMYHRVWPGQKDGLTVTPEQLEEQWQFLKTEGYTAISLEDFIATAKGDRKQSGREVLLTFDDGYQNNLTYVYPLLRKMGWKAVFFVIADSLKGNIDADDQLNRKLTEEELKTLDPEVVQIAMHGYHHENFKELTIGEMQTVIEKTIDIFQSKEIPLHKSIAYPFGGRPKNSNTFNEFKSWMRLSGISAGFRIGNQVSKVPAEDIYEIKRIDIRGTDSLDNFKIKLRKGKLKPF